MTRWPHGTGVFWHTRGMTRTIIFCVDGSELSSDAVRKGATLLQPGDRNILLTVADSPDQALLLGASGFAGGTVTPETFKEMQEAAQSAANEVLHAAVAELGSDAPADLELVAITGNAGAAICAYADEINATTIVIGSRGLGGLKRAVLGSVSDHVVRHSPCAVLIFGDVADVHDHEAH